MGGSVDYIDGCIGLEFSVSVIRYFTIKLGYSLEVEIKCKLPSELGQPNLIGLNENHVTDMAVVGLIYGKVEMFLLDAYQNRIVQSQVDSNNAAGLRDNEEIDVNCKFNEVNEQGDKILYDSEGEKFYDNDYEFHEEDDDLIYCKYGNVVDVDENGDIVLNSKVGLERNGAGNSGGQCHRTRVTSEKNQSRGSDDDDDTDLHVYDEKNIAIVDESDSMISEELLSLSNSSDEEGNKTHRPKFKKFRNADLEDPTFCVGMVFESKMQFENAIDSYAMKWGKERKYKKNDKDRMRVCKSKKCGRFMHASRMQGTENFQIKTIGPMHKCGRSLKNNRVTSTFLSKRYLEYLRLNLNVSIGDFQDMVHRQLNVNVTRNQVYRTFVKAKAIIYGKYNAQYKKLMDYDELLRTNAGSTIELLTDDDELSGKQRFKRLYICFEAIKNGFLERCRPVFGVDCCHLGGHIKENY
ncbi:hypothetical protein ACH5RR_001450 [Cinchona calisaya]|uniref:Transposase MuDR plant domain-containing protein n=1 Tax=Cinchona calisaya TaxID=153742 RepID=A0ABD3B4P0_9GENT